MKTKIFVVVLALCFFGNHAFAQLQNGDFSQGGTYWDWYSADTASGSSCLNALNSSGPRVSGAIARGHTGSGNNSGHRTLCGAIRQTVQIPPGTQLKYFSKLGDVVSIGPGQGSPRDVTLQINLLTNQGRKNVSARTGRSVRSPCSVGCPSFRTTVADVSEFWGQNVTLEIFAGSGYVRDSLGLTVNPMSQAYIDYVEFESVSPNTSASPTSGLWHNPNRSGHGINISRSSTGQRMLVWYTYLPSGTPVWYMSDLASMSGGTWVAALNKATRDPVSGNVVQQPVGTVEITMLANNELIFHWNLNAQSGSPGAGAERMVHLAGGSSYTGMWFEPAFSGWGVTLDNTGSGSSANNAATIYFYTSGGQPVWAQGVSTGDVNSSSGVTFSMQTFVGSNLCPGCTGPSSTTASPAGTLNMRTLGTNPRGYSNIQTTGGVTWVRGSSSNPVTMARLTLP